MFLPQINATRLLAKSVFWAPFQQLEMARRTFRCKDLLIKLYSTNAASNTSDPLTQQTTKTLTWPEFFKLRKRRRRIESLTSIPTALAGLGLGGAFFFTRSFDATATWMGADLAVWYVLGDLVCGGVGWLLGPALGRRVWSAMHRELAAQMLEKERLFFHHVQKSRAIPLKDSYSNPIPDYYGEKISSLHDYRRWLRDQKAFIQKASWGTRRN
ncbi:TIM23 translocase complex-associated motor subunit Pam17 [Schizosaccharomyces japonicus yFS275]|uniref:Presequence translocated-associated motor subunit PAM17 n=1 Tax=Schizosaccharomyces japonicus (strain yFS275 / FY16936) TaxID=402676 RepID=B6K6U3_SCHJY|nr:TIM23 translocase complex-associated motor subunit Pam17 [Schizosaccharomyces japonicus yFS275]EEB09247.2 TIM23 translocase complex-associated motor subunit Pam17 [Schizosaccharomyces japonicus yFS275]